MRLTLGELRRLTKDLPDETPVFPDWAPGFSPADTDPVIQLNGFSVRPNVHEEGDTSHYLSLEMQLLDLEDIQEEDEEKPT